MHEDGRFYQMKKTSQWYYENHTPEEALIWQADYPNIVEENERKGIDLDGFAGEKTRVRQTWEFSKRRGIDFGKKGTKVTLARFMDAVATPHKLVQDWAMDRVDSTVMALENDYLRGKKFGAAMSIAKPSQDFDDLRHTCPKTLDIVDRSLRASCANAAMLGRRFVA